MSKVAASEARDDFGSLISRAGFGKERIVLTRRGKEIVALIPIEDLHLLERLIEEEEDRQDTADAIAALAEASEHGTISLEDLKKELGI